MRILFIVPYAPSLIRVRSYNFIQGLAKRGYSVVVACPWVHQKEKDALERLKAAGCELLSVHAPTWRSWFNCAGAAIGDLPLQAVYSWQPRLMRLIEETLSQNEFDVVHVEHLRAGLYGLKTLDFFKQGGAYRGSRPAVVWDSVDCISTLFREAEQKSSNPMKRWILGFEQPRTKSFEAKLLHRFDRVIVTTENEAKSLENLAAESGFGEPERPEVVCNGVDLEKPAGDIALQRLPATVVMTGKMSYHANATAARYLVEEIMPLVWQRRPDACVQIVGQNPTREILRLARSAQSNGNGLGARNVVVTGEVPDVRPYLNRATVAMAPILYGAGVQNKVLEAMAASTPVVATRQAVAALTVRPGRELLVGESPREMAAHVLHLLENLELRVSLGRAGRRFVEENHNWDRALDELDAVYTSVREPSASRSELVNAGVEN